MPNSISSVYVVKRVSSGRQWLPVAAFTTFERAALYAHRMCQLYRKPFGTFVVFESELSYRLYL